MNVSKAKKPKKVKLNKYFTIVEDETVFTLVSPSVMHLYKGRVFENKGVDISIEMGNTVSESLTKVINPFAVIRARMEKSKNTWCDCPLSKAKV